MGEQWVNVGTGQTSTNSSNPGSMNGGLPPTPGIYNNGQYAEQWQRQYVPDPMPTAPSTFGGPISGGGYGGGGGGPLISPQAWKVMGYCCIMGACLFFFESYVQPFYWSHFKPSNKVFSPWATVKNGVNYYSADQLGPRFWRPTREMTALPGKDNVMFGDLHDTHIDSIGNVTFTGELKHVLVTAPFGVVHARNVEDSTIVAREIVIDGREVRTTEKIIGSRKPLIRRIP